MDFFRGLYSWRKLEDLIRRLPSHSLTAEAMADDDELAESLMEREDAVGRTSGPRLSEYTAEVARLDVLSDRLAELIAVVIQAAGGKAPRPRPATRPETAMARAERRRSERRLGSLIDEVLAAQERWSAQEN